MILTVRNLCKSYNSRRVVDRVSFDVAPGSVIGLLGKNGAGKTTTFRMAMGMIRSDQGQVFFNGEEISNLPMYQRARRGMGYLPQETSVFRGLTVRQNLTAILETRPLSEPERNARREQLIEEFKLNRVADSKAEFLSGGEKRRLEVARALVTEPDLILLDEPFSGVDPIAVADLQNMIRFLADRGIGVLLTDHNVRETLNVCDRSFIIYDGRIIAQGNQDQILQDADARRYYLGEQFSM
ncbi:MAG: LPS export ABC transporter ATP-binding protein [Planctomycetes bacterium]|jgi:lipopolysaccharide export system ATP-binding protein|nr:LPS export ABC transporter ATP-binding protein [Planctomycetota bacterium]MBT6453492.1 LPS export ABC transporter ATP-binding protein [Planctomycetota bacterium]MBT6541512.1 LPS export ABC transporter ATP-binding protein [Planctomycetota bacterium]MBT6785725.1 LPS export ABC transporter ATP-binding protein [Planctomycetota bacterium]MBT6967836.1 LPS export ABC transporter ATP-binding protein [Planctomycetota bacterium]